MSYRDDYQEAEREVYWTLPRVFVLLLVLGMGGTILGTAFCALGLIGGAANNAAGVVQKEFYPDALLRKYEWFKDASAALDKKQADVRVYDARLTALIVANTGLKRSQWPRDDREQSSIWMSEEAGIKASYNQLASEYNSEMAKFNWRFTNVGDMPPGATTPLPREYKPYIEQ
jgi:hypothetical protein